MEVRHNPALSRYELATDHGVAVAIYRQLEDRRIFTHTEVPPASEGKGVGSRLVREALDDSRRSGFRIIPACSFVDAFVRRHPEYRDGASG